MGTDLVEISRLEQALERTPTLRDRLFTPAEATLPVASLAARFAAKEALSKALGKRGFYEQVGLDQPAAYERAIGEMAAAAMIPDAQEGFAAFLEKRHPNFVQPANG
jgi:phosphopantetheine--protein transferase-like protein